MCWTFAFSIWIALWDWTFQGLCIFNMLSFDRGIMAVDLCVSTGWESKWLQLYLNGYLMDFFWYLLIFILEGVDMTLAATFLYFIYFLFFCRAERNISEQCQSRLPAWHLCPVPLLKTQPSWQVENENVHTPTPQKLTLSARWQVNMKRGERQSWIWKRLVNLSDVCQQCVARWILNREALVTSKLMSCFLVSTTNF